MKKILWILAVMVLSFGIVGSQAQAFSIDYTGDVKFKLTGYTTSIFDQTELNTWAIVRLTGAYDYLDSEVWMPNSTDYVFGAIWGLTDLINYWDEDTQTFTIEMENGQFSLYSGSYDVNADWQLLVNSSAQDGLDAGEVTSLFSGYDELILSGNFSSGIQGSDPNTTLIVSSSSLTTPATGKGFGYVDLTGGSFFDYFNSNLYTGGSDASILYNLTDAALDKGWGNNIEDPIKMTAVHVPEPTTMLLLGIGLLGVGVARRFRRS